MGAGEETDVRGDGADLVERTTVQPLAPPQDPGMQELYVQQKVEQDPERRLEMITELMLWHAREASFIFIVEPPDAVLTRSNVNWPKGGRLGLLNFATHWSAQKARA